MSAKPRDYKRENSLESPQRKAARRARQRARYAIMIEMTKRHGATKAKKLLAGKDVDHKKKLIHGGSNSRKNLRLIDAKTNRSDKSMFRGKRTTRPKGKGRK